MTVRLREWRRRRGESIYSLAEKASIHWTTVVRIEQGQLSPTVATLEKLAAALGITVRDFFPVEPRPNRAEKGGRRGKGR